MGQEKSISEVFLCCVWISYLEFYVWMYRIRAVMIDSTASFSEDEVIRRQKVQGTDAYHSDLWTEKITEGKVECSVKVI